MGNLIQRSGRFQGWEYSETLAAGTNGTTVPISPLDENKPVSVSLVIGTGEGKIQFTTSSDALVAADTCNWQDWPSGSVSATVSDSLVAPVSALRVVRVSGSVTMEIMI